MFLVGLVVAGLAVTVAGLAAQGRRTRAAVVDAQLRQLLLAGGADVVARSADWGDATAGSWTMAVPAELAGCTVNVRVEPTDAGAAQATVTAAADRRRAVQRMTFKRVEDRWRLTGASLGDGFDSVSQQSRRGGMR